MAASAPHPEPLQTTPLHAEHVSAGARLVPFAGYHMPVQYPAGIISEHLWTREKAGLFDVSHMGQARLVGPDHETAARALEALVPADILNLRPGQQRYTQLLDERAGILDDLMVSRPAGEDGALLLVVNASRKKGDYAHIQARLPGNVRLQPEPDRALLALQGPAAEAVLARLNPDTARLLFMQAESFDLAGIPAWVSRSGYTGEDGFEISVPAARAVALWRTLLAEPEARPVGLGARDSLRLEAGLCLHGHDIDAGTNPVEAGLSWSIQKRRRAEGGFPGAAVIQELLVQGSPRLRVALRPEGRAPAREGTPIHTAEGHQVGSVTSGGFGPSVNGPVAMGYVAAEVAAPGNELLLMVRGRPMPARVVPLPFVPHRYRRG